ncbi:MAG: deoxyribose-phosphate aldolase, partial [Clostridia bacterium]|nr:deoxyribose-phosphate aldolase [Clostridia bacterium]
MNMQALTKESVAAMIDHTNLKAFAQEADIRKLCEEAKSNHFKSVCVNPVFVKFCREQLEGTGVLTCTVISFPLGQTTIAEKVNEAETAVADGCQEFDYVLNVGKLKEHDYAYIEEEMAALTAVARRTGTAVKVIFETCYL